MAHINTALQAQAYADDLRVTRIFHPTRVTEAMVLMAQAHADALWAAAMNGGAR